MSSERKLIALVAQHDPTLTAYASMLVRQPVASTRSRTMAPSGTVCVQTDYADLGDGIAVSTPDEVQYEEAPTRWSVSRTLAHAARDDVAALLTPESAGRGLACRLVRAAPCSVWFVPERSRPRIERILVPVDFSVRAADCMRVATGLARLHDAACHALHVRFTDSALAADWRAQSIARACADDFVRFLRPIDCLGAAVTPLHRDAADVSRVILDAAREHRSDLIVLATRGRGWLGGLLRPSIAEQVIRTSTTPVLVVKHFGARLRLSAALAPRPFSDPSTQTN